MQKISVPNLGDFCYESGYSLMIRHYLCQNMGTCLNITVCQTGHTMLLAILDWIDCMDFELWVSSLKKILGSGSVRRKSTYLQVDTAFFIT
jgi:hypothetical protein